MADPISLNENFYRSLKGEHLKESLQLVYGYSNDERMYIVNQSKYVR